ncbi:MAG: nucleotidyl transferase AbiEii/AbiGii toxin family protein [Chloroflexaceae bacterium]|jgi:hypothetical protein|nr:nucleotidyl transferase AbiEii/AbiGii toxin family protein [Chloroflexaceae bacterium]
MTQQHFPPVLASWLRRVNKHPLDLRFLLSGSALIALHCPNARIPNDLDYVVTGAYDFDLMVQALAEIVVIPDPLSQFHLKGVVEINEYPTEFPGLRAEVSGSTATNEQHEFLIDFSYGDPLTVPPRRVNVADVGSVFTVALESLFAWKIHALVQFGPYDWRPKDIYDISIMWNEGRLYEEVLPHAIDIAFSSRGSTLDELDDFRFDNNWGVRDDDIARWNEFAQTYHVQHSFLSLRAEVRWILDELL